MGLAVRGLTVRYGRRVALEGLDLDVPDGAITGFLGHNGAGKTTAMRGVLGLTPQVSGQVRVDGHDAFARPGERLARIGALIEQADFQPGWSARRNLVELGRLQGLGRAEAAREAGLRLEQVGLTHAAERRPQTFSQGMRQRLGLAQALLGGRRILLLDEPTNGLDPEGIAELWSLLRDLRDREGAAILLSSHLLAEVDALCDRVAVLREGRLVAAGTIEALRLASGNRHRLTVDDEERARDVLQSFELAAIPGAHPGEFEVDLAGQVPAEVLRALVECDARPSRFGPAGGGLAAVYAAAAHGSLSADLDRRSVEPAPPRDPGRALPRLLGFELRRHLSLAWLALVPLLAGAMPVALLVREAAAQRAAVAGGEQFSTTTYTAFFAAAKGLKLGLPLAALIAMLVASQLVAGELGRGTLRNVALRPLSRLQLGLAKAGMAAVLGLVALAATFAGALGTAAWAFDFGDVVEYLFSDQYATILAAEEIRPDFEATLWGAGAIVLGFAALGLLAGTLARRGVTAVGLALGLFLGLTVVRWATSGASWEWLNPATYLPFLAADASHTHALAVLATGATNVPFEYGATELSVPLTLAAAASVASVLILRRRAIP